MNMVYFNGNLPAKECILHTVARCIILTCQVATLISWLTTIFPCPAHTVTAVTLVISDKVCTDSTMLTRIAGTVIHTHLKKQETD